jgi:hypothetical protein
MSGLFGVALALGTPFVGLWFYCLQTRLEHWVNERHAMD